MGRLRGPCSAKPSLEMEEETDWSQISHSDKRSYINARPHASGAVSEILEKYGWQVLPHPPYSPEMSPPAFGFFPKLKKPLRGKRFRSVEEVSNEVTLSNQTHQQRRRPDRNTWLAQTLDHCDKAQWRLHWRPVNVFCKINSFLKRKRTVCRTFEMTHVLHTGDCSKVFNCHDSGLLAFRCQTSG